MNHYYSLISKTKKIKRTTRSTFQTQLLSSLLAIFTLSGCIHDSKDTPVTDDIVTETTDTNTPADNDTKEETTSTPETSLPDDNDTEEETTSTPEKNLPVDNDKETEKPIIADTTPPVITLNGELVINYAVGDVYTELGVAVTDDVDSALTAVITGNVDINIAGIYTITYTATDSAGNTATATRTVNVTAPIEDGVCDLSATVGLDENMEAAITLAESRYADLLENVSKNSKKYISYTDTSGEWEFESSSNWASGFLPGTLWYLYGLTEKESWKTAAEESTEGLASRATSTDNDTGFQIYGSYGIGRNMLGGTWDEADTMIDTAANTLVNQRYNSNVGAFRAWPQSESDAYDVKEGDEFEVNVDMIMNMEVILSAIEKSNNSTHLDAVISHGDIAWDNLMREDFGSYHVAGFNADGSLNYNRTHQGWHEDSTWSRGQSWAVYGYAMLYQYTKLPRMLERSENSYQYFKQAAQEQGDSWVAFADFDAEIDLRNPLDTSASAIVASAALSLYEITDNVQYLIDANDIINALMEGYLSEGTDFESLLLAGSEKYVREKDASTPDSEGYEVGSSFGDFYFVEALYRLKHATAPVCDE